MDNTFNNSVFDKILKSSLGVANMTTRVILNTTQEIATSTCWYDVDGGRHCCIGKECDEEKSRNSMCMGIAIGSFFGACALVAVVMFAINYCSNRNKITSTNPSSDLEINEGSGLLPSKQTITRSISYNALDFVELP